MAAIIQGQWKGVCQREMGVIIEGNMKDSCARIVQCIDCGGGYIKLQT